MCRDTGISLDGLTAHLLANSVESNSVLRCRVAGVSLPGLLAGAFAVAENVLSAAGHGIRELGSSDGFLVRDNDIRRRRTEPRDEG